MMLDNILRQLSLRSRLPQPAFQDSYNDLGLDPKSAGFNLSPNRILKDLFKQLTESYQSMSLEAARCVMEQLSAKPDSCIGLPTGRTPIGCYQFLAEWSRQGKISWRQARCFALDEYLGVERPLSFAHFLSEHLYRYTDLPETSQFNPLAVDDYDRQIELCGGLDLILVGIGRNGHVAFNEPGTIRESWTHCVRLTDSTRQANSAFFGSLDKVPYFAVTMGLKTILASRCLVLIASGEKKHSILTRALTGPITTEVPASFLQSHPALKVFTDFNYTAVQ